MDRKSLPDGLWAFFACLLWSSAFVAIKAGYSSEISPFLFAGIRFFLSGLLLMPVVLHMEGKGSIRAVFRDAGGFIILVGLLQTALTYAAFYAGVGLVPASVAAIIIGLQPLITSSLSSVVPPKERLALRQWLFLLAAVAGLVILSLYRNRSGGESHGSAELLGIFLLIIALISSAAVSILVSRSKKKFTPMALSSGQFLVGGLVLLLVSILVEDNSSFVPDSLFLISLIWLIFVSSAGISIWFWLLRARQAPAGALSVWKFVIPVLGAALGWTLISGDSPDIGSLAGMVLIAGSVLGFFRYRS